MKSAGRLMVFAVTAILLSGFAYALWMRRSEAASDCCETADCCCETAD